MNDDEQHGRSGIGRLWQAVCDVIIAFVKSLTSAIAQMMAVAVVGGIGGAALSLYLGFGVLPGLVVGAVFGLVVVTILLVVISTDGGF